jgi:hypothetical protein
MRFALWRFVIDGVFAPRFGFKPDPKIATLGHSPAG